MRVFVLTTGRAGSLTFARSCEAMTNFSSGHETRSSLYGADRFDYPDMHIEVDNRLGWLLGSMAKFERPGDRYVHLVRDAEATAQSFSRRLEIAPPTPFRLLKRIVRGHPPVKLNQSIITAFAHTIIDGQPPDAESRIEVSRFFVQAVTDNITEFLRTRVSLTVRLGQDEDFRVFWSWIGATGSFDRALSSWNTRHNASRPG